MRKSGYVSILLAFTLVACILCACSSCGKTCIDLTKYSYVSITNSSTSIAFKDDQSSAYKYRTGNSLNEYAELKLYVEGDVYVLYGRLKKETGESHTIAKFDRATTSYVCRL